MGPEVNQLLCLVPLGITTVGVIGLVVGLKNSPTVKGHMVAFEASREPPGRESKYVKDHGSDPALGAKGAYQSINFIVNLCGLGIPKAIAKRNWESAEKTAAVARTDLENGTIGYMRAGVTCAEVIALCALGASAVGIGAILMNSH